MSDKLNCQNAVAKDHGFKDWNDLFWNGDITQTMIDDVLEKYGKERYEVGFQMGVKITGLN